MPNIGNTQLGILILGQSPVLGNFNYYQAQAKLNSFSQAKTTQAQGTILAERQSFVQASFLIKPVFHQLQSQASIQATVNRYTQAQTKLNAFDQNKFAQSHTTIKIIDINNSTQAQGHIKIIGSTINFTYVQSLIKVINNKHSQAQAMVRAGINTTQVQGYIQLNSYRFMQAQAWIGHFNYTQAQAFIKGQDDRYLVKYNNYTLPGWAQREAFDSIEAMARHPVHNSYSLTEYLGLQNKSIEIEMLDKKDTYYEAKQEVQKAATYLRSKRSGFGKLYIQQADKYYLALPKSISMDKEVRSDSRTIQYKVSFEAKPWLLSDHQHIITGTTLITTDSVGRDITSGGWTPATVRLTGNNIVVSGYTDTEAYTGFISVSGTTNNLIVDSENFTATINGANKNSIMNNLDYDIYVGPGKTYFEISGATSCQISYRDRWYL